MGTIRKPQIVEPKKKAEKIREQETRRERAGEGGGMEEGREGAEALK